MKNQATKELYFQLLLVALSMAVLSTMIGYGLGLIEQNTMIETGMLPEYLALKQSQPFYYAVFGYGPRLYSRGDAIFTIGLLTTASLLALVILITAIEAWKSKKDESRTYQ